jgi:hypothetical protein
VLAMPVLSMPIAIGSSLGVRYVPGALKRREVFLRPRPSELVA